eukprot:m.299162 g.299162  ORF g.299162 m.299162 type:complete len:99 (+) comp14050_c0_seq1:765-1061(+)
MLQELHLSSTLTVDSTTVLPFRLPTFSGREFLLEEGCAEALRRQLQLFPSMNTESAVIICWTHQELTTLLFLDSEIDRLQNAALLCPHSYSAYFCYSR